MTLIAQHSSQFMQVVIHANKIMLAKLSKSSNVEVKTVSCDAPDD